MRIGGLALNNEKKIRKKSAQWFQTKTLSTVLLAFFSLFFLNCLVFMRMGEYPR